MVDATLNELITLTERELHMVAGLNTQVYAKEFIAQQLQQAFDFIFDDKEWKRFEVYEQRTLDGVTGEVTVAFTNVTSYDDIIRVFPENSDRALTYLNKEHNRLLNSTGGFPRFLQPSPNAGKLITVWPLNSTGDILLIGKARQQADYALDQTVPFDKWCLVFYAAWSVAMDDGANPGQAQKLMTKFETRKMQVYQRQTRTPIAINDRDNSIPTRWTE